MPSNAKHILGGGQGCHCPDQKDQDHHKPGNWPRSTNIKELCQVRDRFADTDDGPKRANPDQGRWNEIGERGFDAVKSASHIVTEFMDSQKGDQCPTKCKCISQKRCSKWDSANIEHGISCFPGYTSTNEHHCAGKGGGEKRYHE